VEFWRCGAYTLAESGPASFGEDLTLVRKAGNVPIGLIFYDIHTDELRIHIVRDLEMWEANALLDKLGITVTVQR
jgi:hypothetical protein